MHNNGFAYVFQGVWLLMISMLVLNGGNAIFNLLPPVEDYIHHFVLLGMTVHVLPVLPWVYLQFVDPIVASVSPSLAFSPEDALILEERAGRYGSFFLLPYPKLFFGILLSLLRTVVKFLYDVTFDFEETVLDHPFFYRRTIRFRNYVRSKRGQAPLPENKKQSKYADSSTSTTLTGPEVARACMKPRDVCDGTRTLLENADRTHERIMKRAMDERDETERTMQTQIDTLQAMIPRETQWDYLTKYHEERRAHEQTRAQLTDINKQLVLYSPETTTALQAEISERDGTINKLKRDLAVNESILQQRIAMDEEGRSILQAHFRTREAKLKKSCSAFERRSELLAEERKNYQRLYEEERRKNAKLSEKVEMAESTGNDDSARMQSLEKKIAELQLTSAETQQTQPADEDIDFGAWAMTIPNHIKEELEKKYEAGCEQAREAARQEVQGHVEEYTRKMEENKTECDQRIAAIKQQVEKEWDQKYRHAVKECLEKIEENKVMYDQKAAAFKQQVEAEVAQKYETGFQQYKTKLDLEYSMQYAEKSNEAEQKYREMQQHCNENHLDRNQIPPSDAAPTAAQHRIKELEEEVAGLEVVLHQEKTKERSVYQENRKLKEEYARIEAENLQLKGAGTTASILAPAPVTPGPPDTSIAADTSMDSLFGDPAPEAAESDVMKDSDAPDQGGMNADEEDSVFKELLAGANAEQEQIDRENALKAEMKDHVFNLPIAAGVVPNNPFAASGGSSFIVGGSDDDEEEEEQEAQPRKILKPKGRLIYPGLAAPTTQEQQGHTVAQKAPRNRPTTSRKQPGNAYAHLKKGAKGKEEGEEDK